MQYTAKVALLAVALFGTSVLAVPFGSNAEYDLEAREVDNDLSAREFFDMYLEARANPSLSARDVESMDLEAREYLEYLEARDAAKLTPPSPQAGPEVPLAPAPPSEPPAASTSSASEVVSEKNQVVSEKNQTSVGVETSSDTSNSDTSKRHHHKHHHHKHHHHFETPHQEAIRAAKEAALLELKSDPKLFQTVLMNPDDKLHKFAVEEYLLRDRKAYHEALTNEGSPFHKVAKHIRHRRTAMRYLRSRKHFKYALRHKHAKYHKDAVRKYFRKERHFLDALRNRKSRLHQEAVMEYLLYKPIREEVLAQSGSPYYKAAVHLQAEIDERKHHHHYHRNNKGSDPTVSTSSEVSVPPVPQQAQ